MLRMTATAKATDSLICDIGRAWVLRHLELSIVAKPRGEVILQGEDFGQALTCPMWQGPRRVRTDLIDAAGRFAQRPPSGETHEYCPRNALRASRRNARVAVSVVGHEE